MEVLERTLVALDNPDRLAEIKTELVSDRLFNGDPGLWYDIYAIQVRQRLEDFIGENVLVDTLTLELFDSETKEKIERDPSLHRPMPSDYLRLIRDDPSSPYYDPFA